MGNENELLCAKTTMCWNIPIFNGIGVIGETIANQHLYLASLL